ncbi:hypothetical protein [Nocardiopsis ganjiahuensis]|uniref:hypothetical protein n=1 Tax=Nocardiopsis ganjiahuensis TaxID=239984 RepID=UPI00035F5FC8|nr:hypothetical protein [Nocardiopsis ganjiahuensis]
MARYWFGDQPADVVVATGDQVEVGSMLGYHAILTPNTTLHLYDYTTGDRILDLLDATGEAATSISTLGDGRIPRFRGPSGVERMLIGQDPATLPPEADPTDHQWTILTTSYPDIVDGLRTRIADLEADAGGEYVSSAHPMPWVATGTISDHTSPHVVANLDGRAQTVAHIRATATLDTSSQITATVYTVDLDTGTHTAEETLVLTTAAPAVLVTPTWMVADGAGLTVGVVVDSGSASDLTVQVMVK